MQQYQKNNAALFIALLFHISGFIGIVFTPYKEWFIQNTPTNLLIMAVLLVFTHPSKTKQFIFFIALSFIVGILVEIIGVNTSLLFGTYQYSSVLGIKILHVPVLIGVTWFTTVFCSGIIMQHTHIFVERRYAAQGKVMSKNTKRLSLIIDGALLTVFFDYVLEPVALKLNFWQWQGGVVPLYNYVCWFIVSALLLLCFQQMKFNKVNHFAIHLFIIQLLFFLALSIYL